MFGNGQCKLANHPTWLGPQKGLAARVSSPSAQKASLQQDVQQASQHTEPENIIYDSSSIQMKGDFLFQIVFIPV